LINKWNDEEKKKKLLIAIGENNQSKRYDFWGDGWMAEGFEMR